MMRRLLPLLALLLPMTTLGVTLTFDEPSTNVDGTPLQDLTMHEVERNSGGVFELLTTLPASGLNGGQTVTYDVGNPTVAGEYCYRVRSVDLEGLRSDYSNTACKPFFGLVAPAAPANLRVD